MALTENISPPRPEVAFGLPLLIFVTRGMGEEGVKKEAKPAICSWQNLASGGAILSRVGAANHNST